VQVKGATIMIRVELKVLQANLDFYMTKLEEGEQIDVLENGVSIYKLTEPFGRSNIELPKRERKLKERPFGLMKGQFVVPDNYDDLLSPEMIDEMVSAPFCSPGETDK
jgi:hypothetical protein